VQPSGYQPRLAFAQGNGLQWATGLSLAGQASRRLGWKSCRPECCVGGRILRQWAWTPNPCRDSEALRRCKILRRCVPVEGHGMDPRVCAPLRVAPPWM